MCRGSTSRSVAMKLTGHKTEAVYRRYAIVAESDLREAGAKLAAALRTTAATTSLSDNPGDNSDSAERALVKRLKRWWAGTGLDRRHQDFQSVQGVRTICRHRQTSFTIKLIASAERPGSPRSRISEHGARYFRQSFDSPELLNRIGTTQPRELTIGLLLDGPAFNSKMLIDDRGQRCLENALGFQ